MFTESKVHMFTKNMGGQERNKFDKRFVDQVITINANEKNKKDTSFWVWGDAALDLSPHSLDKREPWQKASNKENVEN